MEQYFTKQLSNCCKLNFNNQVIKSNQIIISPQKTKTKPDNPTHKSQKKSLKRIHSDHALALTKKTNRQTQCNFKNSVFAQQEQAINDYGQPRYANKTNENKLENSKLINFSAHQTNVKLFKSLQRKQASPEKNSQPLLENLRNYRFSDKTTNIKSLRIQPPRPSLVIQNRNIMTQNNQPQYQLHLNPLYLRQNSTIINPITFPHSHKVIKFQHSPIYVRSPIKNQTILPIPSKSNFEQKTTNYPQTLVLNKNSSNYSQSFKKIYGEVQIQDQIKQDLMKSLDFHRVDSQPQFNCNGVSIMTKSLPSQESTILPPESKLRKKADYQLDSFSFDRKINTQKYLKASSPFGQKPSSRVKCQGRQKFKSIVSVQSEHSSSQSVDSIIIDQHPQKLLSSNPIKSLL